MDIVEKKIEAPNTKSEERIPHELLMPETRRLATIGEYIKHRQLVAGSAQGEQLSMELDGASKINRGPPNAFHGSRLHFDVATNRDGRIDYSDYLGKY